jgi:nucleoside-diphosphate-sugar epimerase
MRVLVIGGTAFIGPHVVHALVNQGHEVTVFHRGSTEAELPVDVDHLHGERSDLLAHAKAFDRLAPDVVLHMVPMSERDAEAAVHAFEGRTSRLVAISSGDVYRARNRLFRVEPGPPDPVPLSENSPLRSVLHPYRAAAPAPDHPLYHYDKIPVERIVMHAAALPGTVLRLPIVYVPETGNTGCSSTCGGWIRVGPRSRSGETTGRGAGRVGTWRTWPPQSSLR